MNSQFSIRRALSHYLVIAIILLEPTMSYGESSIVRTFHIKGEPVTGFNEVCGEPVVELPLPPPLPSTFHGAFIGEYDPDPGAGNITSH